MKKTNLFSIIIALLVLAGIDAITFVLTKSDQFDRQFWLGFIFLHVSFLVFILTKLLVKNEVEERGVRPLDVSSVFYIVSMFLLALISYLVPYKVAVFNTLLVFYIIMTTLMAILVAFSILNKYIVKQQTGLKPVVYDESDVVSLLNQSYEMSKDTTISKQLNEIIDLVNGLEFDKDSLYGKQLVEYSQFIYKNVKRNEMSNVSYNIKKVKEIIEQLTSKE